MNKETVADEMFRSKIETDAKVNQIENETKILEATSKQESIIRRDKNSEREDNARTARVVTEETAKARIANSDAITHEELNKCDVDDRRNEVEHKKKNKDLEIQAKIQELNEKARKEVKVFVASNPEELEEERTALSALVAQINKILAPRNTNIIIKHSREIEILSEVKDELKASDMCVVLFCEELDKSSKEEMDEGFQEVKQTNNLKRVHVYFKETDTASEDIKSLKRDFTSKYGQRFFKFVNIDSLKLNFVMQLEDVQSKMHSDLVKVQDSKVEYGGVPVADLKNIPFACNNETYRDLDNDIEKVEKEIETFEVIIKTTPNDAIEQMIGSKRTELYNLKEKRNNLAKDLVSTAQTIVELQTKSSSERLHKAIELFESGDNKGADALLDMKDIERDAEINVGLVQAGKEAYKAAVSNIVELKLKAQNVLTIYDNENRFDEADEAYQKAIDIAERIELEGNEMVILLREYHSFLITYARYNNILNIGDDLLSICLSFYGKEHSETSTIYNNIGLAYIELGNYVKALECLENSLAIIDKTVGSEDIENVTIYNNIGLAYSKLGDYIKALDYITKSLAIIERNNDPTLANTTSCYNLLGFVYSELGDYKESMEYCQKTLQIRENVFGKDHPNTANSYHNIGALYLEAGYIDKAIENFERALPIYIKFYGKSHKDTATIFQRLGLAYRESGNYNKALDCLVEARDVYETALNVETSDMAKTFSAIGQVYYLMGEYEKAMEYHNKALKIKEKTLGIEDASTATSYDRIGDVYIKLGDNSKANEFIEKALAIYEKLYGKEHPDYIKCKEKIEKLHLP